MFRKTSIYIYVYMSMSAVLYSCVGEFLERAPSDFINIDEVFENIADAEAFLNNAYADLPSMYAESPPDNTYFNWGAGSDEGVSMLYEAALGALKFNYGDWNPSSFPGQHRWGKYYRAIRRINLFIENFESIPDEALDSGSSQTTRKLRLLGEAHALRAMFYFQLFKMWGEVPLISSVVDPGGEETELVRSPVDEIVQFIQDDLYKAIENLPARMNDSNKDRINATTCYALLSRVLLYAASPLFNPDNEINKWELAVLATEQAINYAENNSYFLSEGTNNEFQAYERIFLELNNPEVIQYNAEFSVEEHMRTVDFYSSSHGYGGWHVEAPIQDLIDDYETVEGLLPVLGYDEDNKQIINPESKYDPDNPYHNRDPRLAQTILFQGATWKGREIDIREGGADYNDDRPRVLYFWRKYNNESFNLISGSGHANRKFVLFRLSELYLNYAEALNEVLESPDDRVYNSVNIIRKRVGMPDLPIDLDKKTMRDRIRHERRIEFVMENQRFWDVRRWKIAEHTDNGPVRKVEVSSNGEFTYPIYHEREFDPKKHYLFPIPQLEIEKSNETLIQNPGW